MCRFHDEADQPAHCVRSRFSSLGCTGLRAYAVRRVLYGAYSVDSTEQQVIYASRVGSDKTYKLFAAEGYVS